MARSKSFDQVVQPLIGTRKNVAQDSSTCPTMLYQNEVIPATLRVHWGNGRRVWLIRLCKISSLKCHWNEPRVLGGTSQLVSRKRERVSMFSTPTWIRACLLLLWSSYSIETSLMYNGNHVIYGFWGLKLKKEINSHWVHLLKGEQYTS